MSQPYRVRLLQRRLARFCLISTSRRNWATESDNHRSWTTGLPPNCQRLPSSHPEHDLERCARVSARTQRWLLCTPIIHQSVRPRPGHCGWLRYFWKNTYWASFDLGRGRLGWTHASSICAGSGLPPSGVFAWPHWESDGTREFHHDSCLK